MRVLLLGSGGREHALATALAADPSVTELHCAPGNPGIAAIARVHPADLTDLPPNAQRYVERIEELCGARVSVVGVGPGREENVVRHSLL